MEKANHYACMIKEKGRGAFLWPSSKLLKELEDGKQKVDKYSYGHAKNRSKDNDPLSNIRSMWKS